MPFEPTEKSQRPPGDDAEEVAAVISLMNGTPQLLNNVAEVARHAGGANQRPHPRSLSRAGRGEITHKSCVLQPLLGLIVVQVALCRSLRIMEAVRPQDPRR